MFMIYVVRKSGESWFWIYDSSVEQLLEDWKTGRIPLGCVDQELSPYRGQMVRVNEALMGQFQQRWKKTDQASACMRGRLSWLKLGKQTYRLSKLAMAMHRARYLA
jgi:hypothetical protein